jgi:hypothetical protein
MAEVASIERLLGEGVEYLGDHGSWLDVVGGRAVYDRLRRRRPRVYNPAVVRFILKAGQRRRRLLHLAIKLGVRGSEEKLAEVLNAYGTQQMAVDYLNAGSPHLRAAAESWARRHGYRIYYTSGRSPVTWGRF